MVKPRARRIRQLLGGTAALLLIGLGGCAYDPYYDGGGYGYSPGYAYGSGYSSGYAYGSDYYYPGGGYYASPGASVYYYSGSRNRYYRDRDDHDRKQWRDRDHRRDRGDWNRGDRRGDRGNWNRGGGRDHNWNRGGGDGGRDHRGGGRGRDVSPLPGHQRAVR